MATTGSDLRTHRYAARLVWTGNRGEGTSSYAAYERSYAVHVAGKPKLLGSSDPMYRGDPARHNPEDLFLASIAACHMLFYLSLCARRGIRVLGYEDDAIGTIALHTDGGGHFIDVTLVPVVTIAEGGDTELALRLHDTAHELCFIANSCSVPIHHRPAVRTAAGVLATEPKE